MPATKPFNWRRIAFSSALLALSGGVIAFLSFQVFDRRASDSARILEQREFYSNCITTAGVHNPVFEMACRYAASRQRSLDFADIAEARRRFLKGYSTGVIYALDAHEYNQPDIDAAQRAGFDAALRYRRNNPGKLTAPLEQLGYQRIHAEGEWRRVRGFEPDRIGDLPICNGGRAITSSSPNPSSCNRVRVLAYSAPDYLDESHLMTDWFPCAIVYQAECTRQSSFPSVLARQTQVPQITRRRLRTVTASGLAYVSFDGRRHGALSEPLASTSGRKHRPHHA